MGILDIQNLTKAFPQGGVMSRKMLLAVDDLSLAISSDKPAILSIVGESGSGKTTLARMILRILDSSSGSISVGDVNIVGTARQKLKPSEFRRMIQPIFQNPFEAFSMRKKVESYLYETALNLGIATSRESAQKVIAESLEAVGLDLKYIAGKFASQFSGGELQRISIARALICKPKLIIADEPVAMIDASLKMNIVNLFLKLKEEYGVSFVYITHDLSTAYYVSDYIGIMYHGSLVEHGLSSEILTSPSHPYTRLLMNSIAQVGMKWGDEEAPTDGPIRDDANGHKGCKFYSRCPVALDICKSAPPPRVQLSESRQTLCHMAIDYESVR